MGEGKVNINIVVFGPVGSGKSTTIVHLINKLGGIGKGVAKRVEKEDAEMNNAMWKFETDKYNFTVTDAPGHPDFSNNIITGVRDADCAILIVDSSTSTGDFEVGTSRNGQTCQPALLLAHTLGVEQMICCCNKMDATTPNYSKERYDEIKKSTSSYLKMVGYDPVKIPFVPISGLNGDNLIERSPKLQWYIGPTLREALNQIQEPKRPIDKPLRLPIEDVYKIGGIGTVAVGRVETGILKPGMKVTFGPTGLTAKVKSIEIDHKPVQEALAGDSVRFSLKKMDPNDLRSGYVASNSKDDPAKEAISFTSQIIITTSHHEGLVFEGYTTSIDLGSYCGAVKIEKFHRKIDPITGMEVEKEPKFLQNGDVVIVEMVPKKPMVVETCGEYPPLGRFIIRDKEQIVGVGVIKSVEKKEYPNNGANKGIKSAVMKRSKQFGAGLVNGGKKFGTLLVNVSIVVAFQLGTALANNCS